MNLPKEILEKITEISNNFETKQLNKKFKEVSERYCAEKTGKRLLTNQDEAIAYSISRMPATFGAVSTAFTQTLLSLFQKTEFNTLVDIGAGTGAATLAIAEQIPLENITCLEREEAMINVGSTLLDASEIKSVRDAKWKKFDIMNEELSEEADIVVVSYMLNELDSQTRLKVVEKLWNNTNQILLIVDPGTPKDFENLIQIKNFLVKKGAKVIAPCSREEGCDLPKNDWCHFLCRVERTRLHKNIKEASVPYEDEKFTYLAVSKENIGKTENRIIRTPIQKTNFIELRLCEKGKIEDKIYTKKEKEVYKKLKKMRVGETLDKIQND